jgi:hypothetical protein
LFYSLLLYSYLTCNIVKSFPHEWSWRPVGLRDVKDPTLSRKATHRMMMFLYFWYLFFLQSE